MADFKDLGISEKFIQALKENGIVQPSLIQERAIPYLIQQGGDFIGQAQTGTGKTAAFGLPILQRIDPKNPNIQAMILAPTRELTQQIAKQLFKFTRYSEKIFTEAVYGGEKIDVQMSRLSRTTHIVVATPGRLVDLLEKKAINLSYIKTIVLDEADEMLSMGFKKELSEILKLNLGKRATWLFSATLPDGIRQIIGDYMAPNAYKVEINKSEKINSSIDHQYVVGEEFEKIGFLLHFLKVHKGQRGIIFCKTKIACINLTKNLQEKKIPVDTIHGDLLQKERDKVMRAFKNKKLQLLVATDISARGIDVENVEFVVHFQLPDQLEYYIHRSGRTGRAGRTGLSVAFIDNSEVPKIKELEKSLNIKIKRIAT